MKERDAPQWKLMPRPFDNNPCGLCSEIGRVLVLECMEQLSSDIQAGAQVWLCMSCIDRLAAFASRLGPQFPPRLLSRLGRQALDVPVGAEVVPLDARAINEALGHDLASSARIVFPPRGGSASPDVSGWPAVQSKALELECPHIGCGAKPGELCKGAGDRGPMRAGVHPERAAISIVRDRSH